MADPQLQEGVAVPETVPAKEVAPPATVPAEEVSKEEATAPVATGELPTELPENWDDHPLFRQFKSWTQSQIDAAVNKTRAQAYQERDAEWTGWGQEVTKRYEELASRLEEKETAELEPEAKATYFERKLREKEVAERLTQTQQQQLRLYKANLVSKHDLPPDLINEGMGFEGMVDTAIKYVAERNKPKPQPIVTRRPVTPAEPPKVATKVGKEAPASVTKEFQSLPYEEKRKILNNPTKARELFEQAGNE